jgi:hypothetical protein
MNVMEERNEVYKGTCRWVGECNLSCASRRRHRSKQSYHCEIVQCAKSWISIGNRAPRMSFRTGMIDRSCRWTYVLLGLFKFETRWLSDVFRRAAWSWVLSNNYCKFHKKDDSKAGHLPSMIFNHLKRRFHALRMYVSHKPSITAKWHSTVFNMCFRSVGRTKIGSILLKIAHGLSIRTFSWKLLHIYTYSSVLKLKKPS